VIDIVECLMTKQSDIAGGSSGFRQLELDHVLEQFEHPRPPGAILFVGSATNKPDTPRVVVADPQGYLLFREPAGMVMGHSRKSSQVMPTYSGSNFLCLAHEPPVAHLQPGKVCA
jgi:hypothetical protein